MDRGRLSDQEMPPRQCRPNRSPIRSTKRGRASSHYSTSSSSERSSERRNPRQRRRRSPSPPSSSPKSSSDDQSTPKASSSPPPKKGRGHIRVHPAWKRTHRLQKFKEGGKNITFLNFDGTYGDTNKVLHFIQQFDAAFGGEHFAEGSKLRHVAMYFQKSARHWWATLRAQELAPRTWKECRTAIMKQFLPKGAKDEVLTAWRSFKLEEGETIQKYIDKFWDLHLKATVFSKID